MKIYTFTADDPDSPAPAIARLWGPFGIAKGKTVNGWAVPIFTGPTAEACRIAAQAWWDDEVAKAQAKAENISRGVAKRKAATVPAVAQVPSLGDVL